ncbi:MAG: hypothetical protein JW802_01055 [Campylobacterales bacterium]|nr:hypothetical protein [Campylobacterales bacterium]MBN2832255.1 hypothetical protein [Campylobacterales bacterium]
MIFLIPIFVLVAIIVAIDFFYFSDVTPKEKASKKELSQKSHEQNSTQNYLNRYIKK